ncbi:MAG: PAS domain-containing protein, partial [Candidatus Thorarchaeota archaeon]|nr:PAS domain-containing protein [Candidatus Thorarchaeota archaeon]
MTSDFPQKRSMDIESLEDLLAHEELIESLNEGFGVIDDRNIFTFVNTQFGELLEYTSAEMIGRSIQDFLDDENSSIQQTHIQKRMNKEQSKYELIWTSKTGRLVPTLISGVPIFDKDGKYHGSFAVITDFSAYKAAERKYRLLAEQSLQGLTVTQNDRYAYVNPSFGRI